MSISLVPAAAAAHPKQLVRNKKLTKRADDQKPAQDEQQAADKDDSANAAQVTHHNSSMSDTSLSGGFSFAAALSDAATDSASLAQSSDDGSSSDGGEDAGISSTILLVGAVGLAGLGVAVAAGGGGNKNNAPDITSAATAKVAENAAATTVVYQTVATDPDGDTLTYTLSGADAALFNISSTGAVTLKVPADFETKAAYAFTVTASDGELSDSQAVALTVENVAEGPVFTSTATATTPENVPVSTVVYDANVSAASGTVTFALTGADASSFTIDAATGEVRFKASPNFEADNSYSFGVTATNAGGSTTQAVTLGVTDIVAEGPTFTSAASASVEENKPASTVVYDANATSGAGAIVYSLTGAEASSFTIDAATGEVRLKASADFETDNSYSFGVVATDSLGATTQNVTLAITDVVNEPSIAAIAVTAAGTNTDSDIVATTYTVSLGNYEYTIIGLDAGADKIVGPTGVAPSVINTNFGDGEVTLQYAANNQIALLTIEGLTAQQDAAISGVNSFNTVFGAGTIA
jgi:uncharacterized protein YjlB